MDDVYEKPSSTVSIIPEDVPEEAEGSSDEDDGGPDWTKLSTLATAASNAAKPAIPKRGDKEFEPTGGLGGGGKGSNLQQHKLERVRTAMFSALDVERTVSSKIASYAVWCPEVSRARILSARGSFLTTMGHNVPRQLSTSRPADDVSRVQKLEKAIELLPEEALYLIERGSMFCWLKAVDHASDEGIPMSVQQAYAEMIGKEDLTLERYQVYCFLKRLGYTVTRARPPDPYYHTAAPFHSSDMKESGSGILTRILETLLYPLRRFFLSTSRKLDWWRPLSHRFVHRFLSYRSLFSSLRLMTSGYRQQLHTLPVSTKQPSPYEVFFHLYKPATPYRKTAPPPPDFSVVVVDARKTPTPSLQELCALFEQLPELPPPVPRKRPMRPSQLGSSSNSHPAAQHWPVNVYPTPYTRLRNLLRWLIRFDSSADDQRRLTTAPLRRPNPFQRLKMGKKMIVVAAVDSGMISFFRFCQGSFDEWPMF